MPVLPSRPYPFRPSGPSRSRRRPSVSESATKGAVPRIVGLSRSALELSGFTGAAGQTLVVPTATGIVVAVGLGEPRCARRQRPPCRCGVVRSRRLEARAIWRPPSPTSMASTREPPGRRSPKECCSAAYRYVGRKTDPALRLQARVGGGGRRRQTPEGRRAGRRARHIVARAPRRSPASWPTRRPPTSTPTTSPSVPSRSAPSSGLTVEVFNKDQLEQLGCGGLLGVNRGSVEPPRMVKLTYTPREPSRPPRAGRQGDHVRLGWHLAEGRRRLPPDHEDGHVAAPRRCSRRCRRSRRSLQDRRSRRT